MLNKLLPQWWPINSAIYDIEKSYLDNAEEGPFFSAEIPERPGVHETQWRDFLGYKVASPIGVPAGPLLNSRWIGAAADLGFDILCYKTIRSAPHPGHPTPNMVFIDRRDQLDPANLPPSVVHRPTTPQTMEEIAVTNSFGMPSRDHDYLAEDIPKAYSLLHRGQALIISVVGTPSAEGGFLADCVRVAKQAKDYGAKIIEVNFSCPNVTTGEGMIHTDAAVVYDIASGIVNAIGDTPLIIKVGTFPSTSALEQCMVAAARAGVRAICGINTISMKVVDSKNNPLLGPQRAVSGICGSPIHAAALDFTRNARTINDKLKLDLTIMTTGGAVLPQHFHDFLNAGADIAMTATGMMWDPYLAMRYHYGVANDS
ncbi:MAG: dihydroorotate dehydrogenase [Chlamydiales bacterium]|nr:dihydroorotate dehydrogenase [Chlamydiia bacterium]MCP5508354.1 dihydroorotate dehydrogenase [Chlamydiales bacterium]